MRIGFPGTDASWFENPKSSSGAWIKYLSVAVVDNESATFGDITGDGVRELLYTSKGYLGWAAPDKADPNKPWIFHRISTHGNWERFTHGLGYGDVSGDRRFDFLERGGWWEQPASLTGDPVWTFHPFPFASDPTQSDAGGAQMYAYDVDGDGHKDLVSGKRWWAHGPNMDPEPNAEAVLYAWILKRTSRQPPKFQPIRIDNNSGSGTQLTVGDFTGDGHPDILIGNKKGGFRKHFYISPSPFAAVLGVDHEAQKYAVSHAWFSLPYALMVLRGSATSRWPD